MFASSFSSSFGGWWVCWIVAYAVANGLTYFAPVYHCWLWIPDKCGLISGVILAGVGVSGLIFNNIVACKSFKICEKIPKIIFLVLVNPQHISADPITGWYPESVNYAFIFIYFYIKKRVCLQMKL